MEVKGLNDYEINVRKEKKLVNYDTTIKTKSVSLIVISNIFTLFNILNFFLALLIFIYGNFKNVLFIGVVICNTLISIIQEVRTKKAIDRLSIISCIKVKSLRNNKIENINIDEIVMDDVLLVEQGSQIVTDVIVLDNEVEVNEAYITGESDVVIKHKGDTILSGSFIVSGKSYCKVIHVGEDNYTNKISKEAKYIKNKNSEILNSLNKIIKIISIIIIPLGIIMFIKQMTLNSTSLAITNTVAAIIGMIPEGLVLLTSTTLAISVLHLTKEKILVQNLYSIETLSRIDTLCLDKTGTLTTGELEVIDVINVEHIDYEEVLSNYANSITTPNLTIEAILKKFKRKTNYIKVKEIPFSSSRKYSAIEFKDKGTYILGAPEILLDDNTLKKYDYIFDENRILVLCHSNSSIKDSIPKDYTVLSFISLKDKLRKNVSKTINYFIKQGVNIKIISGDSVKTIEAVGKQIGIECNSINVSIDKEFLDKVEDYNVFSRVNPIEKQKIIKKLKENHVVAYIGDGINDVLALKESDSSIALKNGSEATRNISEVVILDSDFSHLISVIKEGRRTTNNITRSATLFLSKTMYSSMLLFMFLFMKFPFPFIPIQITLISAYTIGIPAFLLTFEPNDNMIKGNFILNVLKKSFPTSLTIIFNIIFISILTMIRGYDDITMSTLSIILTSFTSFMLLYEISKPLNKFRFIILLSMISLFTLSFILFKNLFVIGSINLELFIMILILIVISLGLNNIFKKTFDYITRKVI